MLFKAIAAGFGDLCGLVESGAAYCWGSGENGELGNGPSNSSSVPVPVAGDLRFVGLAAGANHTCGFVSDGTG